MSAKSTTNPENSIPNTANKIHRWSDDSDLADDYTQFYQRKVTYQKDNGNQQSNSSGKNSSVGEESKLQGTKSVQLQQPSSIVDRTQNLYRQLQQTRSNPMPDNRDARKPIEQSNDSNRMLSHYLFTENKRKEVPLTQQESLDELVSSILPSTQRHDSRMDNRVNYLSALNTRRNPDLLIPGATFLKGNMYFKSEAQDVKMKDDEVEDGEAMEVSSLSEEDKQELEAFEKLKNQTARYFIENNPTIKCRNCLEYGHIAKDCTNPTKRPNCILCGKDTHDSFNCNEKICFKCNKVGHVANQCTERNIIKCNRCNKIGHKEIRCLVQWKGNYTDSQMQLIRCMQCGKRGHFKCTKEKQSLKIKVDMHVKDNLDEFIQLAKKTQNQNEDTELRALRFSFDYADELSQCQGKLIENTNIMVATKQNMRTWGIPRNHDPRDIYCCYCAGTHNDQDCPRSYNGSGNMRYQQYEKIRQRLNQTASYEQEQRGDYRNDKTNYHIRLANDPRMANRQQDRNHGGHSDSSDERHNQKAFKKANRKKGGHNYSSSESSSPAISSEYESDSSSVAHNGSGRSSSSSDASDDSEKVLQNFNKIITKKKQQRYEEAYESDESSDYEDHGGKQNGHYRQVRYTGGQSHKKGRWNEFKKERSRSRDFKSKKHHSSNNKKKDKHYSKGKKYYR